MFLTISSGISNPFSELSSNGHVKLVFLKDILIEEGLIVVSSSQINIIQSIILNLNLSKLLTVKLSFLFNITFIHFIIKYLFFNCALKGKFISISTG